MNESDTIKAQLLKSINDVADDLGIYPQAVKGLGEEKDYTQRDGFKNGWNACVMQFKTAVKKSLDLYSQPWAKSEQFFASLDGYFDYSGGKWWVELGDTWYYACADGEEIQPDEYKDVRDLFCLYGVDGVLFWVYKKRQHLPEIKSVAEQVERVIEAEARREAKLQGSAQ
jgi:hypothetical protein